VIPHYINFVRNTEPDPSTWEKTQVTTEMLQVLANGLWICNDMNKNSYKFWSFKYIEF